jgi:ubiquinone/menaquinone biosynthesis C-methylase UbiE
MPDAFPRTDVGGRPVIYAGRFVDKIPDGGLTGDCLVLSEQDALPHKLSGILDPANALILLDLSTFPFEAMVGDRWDVPIIVVIPSGQDVDSLTTNFGSLLFERLGFFDRLVVPNTATWDGLRRRYHWAEGQLLLVSSDHPSEVAMTVCSLLADDRIDHRPRSYKALHRVQAAALEPQFAAAGEKAPLDVLEVGSGAGRWAASFDPTKTRFVGIDAGEDLVETARANFPEGRFDHLSSNLLLPYEDGSFDLVFSVTVMHRYPAPAKRTLLSEMWRVARPGARLVFLETFVFPGQPKEPAIYPMSVAEFEDLILDATAGQVTLENAESLRYPGDDLRRGGLISLLRLGVSRT